MKPSNDNATSSPLTAKNAATAQPLLKDGHENESVEKHLGGINFNTKDGFGNAQWDAKAKKKSVETIPVEVKIPPAF